jgi:inositol-phosphate phosphatase / L-galactose 1-phosphate phosphatase / histidinol-phosphatase
LGANLGKLNHHFVWEQIILTTTTIPAEFIALAHLLAETARPIVRRYFRTPLLIDDKSDQSPVTIADRECESAMREILQKAAPDHGIIGEEWGEHHPEAEWVWVLDPIDGTKAFITGKPCFGTLIALTHFGRPVLGIIDQAITDERWIGAAGYGTKLNGAGIATRPCAKLSHAYAYSTGPELFCPSTRVAWDRIVENVKHARYGADCYAYALLATGFVDLVIESGLKPHDYAALVPVIEGAGGVITDWHGAPLTLASDGNVCAAGDARVHAQALDVLAWS